MDRLPDIASAEKSTAVSTETAPERSLASLYSSSVAPTTTSGTFRPPTPPGLKFGWTPSAEVIPSDPNIDFPMVNYSSFAKTVQ